MAAVHSVEMLAEFEAFFYPLPIAQDFDNEAHDSVCKLLALFRMALCTSPWPAVVVTIWPNPFSYDIEAPRNNRVQHFQRLRCKMQHRHSRDEEETCDGRGQAGQWRTPRQNHDGQARQTFLVLSVISVQPERDGTRYIMSWMVVKPRRTGPKL